MQATIVHHKVVGIRAGHRTHVMLEVNPLDPVLLKPEPSNQFDPNAIAVFHLPAEKAVGPITSSAKCEQFVGALTGLDTELAMSRHAGYLPREIAAQYALPESGIVGWVSTVRWPPEEHWATDDGAVGKRIPLFPCGFDVASAIEQWKR